MQEYLTLPRGYTFDAERLDLHHRAMSIMHSSPGRDYRTAALMAEALVPETVVLHRADLTTGTTLQLSASAIMVATAFAGVAYSGGAIPGPDGPFGIDLAEIQMPRGGRVSLLKNHDPNQIVGQASAQVSGGMLYLDGGRFTDVTPAGREAAGLYAEGQPFALSVGVSGSMERLSDRGTDVELNGRVQTLNAVMRRPRLLEVSLVHAGRDPNARLLPARWG